MVDVKHSYRTEFLCGVDHRWWCPPVQADLVSFHAVDFLDLRKTMAYSLWSSSCGSNIWPSLTSGKNLEDLCAHFLKLPWQLEIKKCKLNRMCMQVKCIHLKSYLHTHTHRICIVCVIQTYTHGKQPVLQSWCIVLDSLCFNCGRWLELLWRYLLCSDSFANQKSPTM